MKKCDMCGKPVGETVNPSFTTPTMTLCDDCIEAIFDYLRQLRGKEKGEGQGGEDHLGGCWRDRYA